MNFFKADARLLLTPIFISMVCYWPFFSEISWSIDDESAQQRVSPFAWMAWLNEGRWGSGFVEAFFTNPPLIPIMPLLVIGIAYGLSLFFLMKCFKAKSLWLASLATLVMVTFPSFVAMNQYYSNAIPAAIGLAASIMSAYLFACRADSFRQPAKADRLRIFRFGLECSLLAFAIACYQTLLFVYCVVGTLVLFSRYVDAPPTPERPNKNLFRMGLQILSSLGTGALIYLVIHFLITRFYPQQPSLYMAGYIRWNELVQSPLQSSIHILSHICHWLTGNVSVYGISFIALPFYLFSMVTVLAVSSLAGKPESKYRPGAGPASGLLIFAVFVPFAFDFITGGKMPLRSNLALPVCLAGILMTLVPRYSAKAFVRLILYLITLVFLFFQIDIYSRYLAQVQLTYDADKATARSLAERIVEANPDFDRRNLIFVDFYGSLDNSNFAYPRADSIGVSFFSAGGGKAYRMIAFLECLGFGNFRLAKKEIRQWLIPEFEKMPDWPAHNSVKYQDGFVLIKLSSTPDPDHINRTPSGGRG